MKKKPISPAGDSWDDFRQTILTPEERAEADIKVALLGEIIQARKDRGLSQKDLESISGVRQPVIARLEHGTTDPQLSTILRVLAPLGKTLAIVPMDQE